MTTPSGDAWGDKWYWRAVYDDGTEVEEYDENGLARGFLNLEHARIKHFVLDSRDPEHLQSYALTRNKPESRVLFFRRRQLTTGPDGGEPIERPIIVTCLGFEGGAYTFFFEDGSVLVSDDVDAV